MIQSLWGEEFNIEDNTQKILKKIKKPKVVEVITEKNFNSKRFSIEDKLDFIKNKVDSILGHYKDNTVVIKTKEELHNYVDESIKNNIIAIDTETNNSLDPLTCKLMGGCIYTPGQKNAYIPINHIDYKTGERLNWQLTEQDVKEEFDRLNSAQVRILTHNGKFDYQVLKCTCNYVMPIYWDSMIAARLLNENEQAGLKFQYIDKIDASQEKYNIEKLFEGLEYAIFDPDLFALYAATDAYMTYRLYEYQKRIFEQPDYRDLFKLFQETEIPIITVSAEMELTGVCIDVEYAQRLSAKYNKLLEDSQKLIDEELQSLQPQIDRWKHTAEAQRRSVKKDGSGEGKSKAEQLDTPVNISSPTQLAILLYDVLQIQPVSKEKPRGTGVEELTEIYNKTKLNFCNLVLKQRVNRKLINTYIDKLPNILNPKTGRLHGSFNQLGTDTGRFASREPNLQNIPSHAKDIRALFKAAPGYKMVGSDFSQAEPRLLAWYSQDEQMIDAYKNKRDLYATVAATVFNNKYEDNLEFYPDGSMNYEGKERRTFCKSIILGIMYGRQAASIAEQTGKTAEEAQKIIDQFYTGFPKVKQWIDTTQENCHRNGYVEDLWGRRRRLPDIQLPNYTIKIKEAGNSQDFNPLLGTSGEGPETRKLLERFSEKASQVHTRRDYEFLKKEADSNGVYICSNIPFIRQAERQSVNARVQGGSATITKRAMVNIYNDPVMRSLGFRILLCIHDEIIGECPENNSQQAAARLAELMLDAPKPQCQLPFKCDADVFDYWYQTEYETVIRSDYEKLNKNFNALVESHSERPTEYLASIVGVAI